MKHSALFAVVLTFLLVEACCQNYNQYNRASDNSEPIKFDDINTGPGRNEQTQYLAQSQQQQSTLPYQSEFPQYGGQQGFRQSSQQQYQGGVSPYGEKQGFGQSYQPQSAPQYNNEPQYTEPQGIRQPSRSPETVTASSEGWDRALTSFSLNMLKSVVKKNQNQNVVISPFSVATILSYLQQVSVDQTQNEISDALLQSPQSSKNSYSSFITKLRQESNIKNTLSVANSLFANENVRFAAQAKDIARSSYGVHIDALNFGNPQSTARTINDWVKKHTHNIIEKIVSPGDIKRNSECIILNSVYFKGVWQKMFDATRTKMLDYSPDSRNIIKKPFMLSNDRYDVGDDDNIGARWISIPYDGNKYAMVFVVPQQKHTLDTLLERMSSNELYTIMNTGEDFKCAIAIPRFNATFDLSLTDVLQELGIRRLFTANSQITKLIQSGQGKSVSSANQKSAISVDESGTVAASVTSIGVNTLSLPSPSELFVLRLNEPFLAILVDKKNKVPLMITKVYDP